MMISKGGDPSSDFCDPEDTSCDNSTLPSACLISTHESSWKRSVIAEARPPSVAVDSVDVPADTFALATVFSSDDCEDDAVSSVEGADGGVNVCEAIAGCTARFWLAS